MKRNHLRGVVVRKRKFSSNESGNNQVLEKYMMKSFLKFLLCAGVSGDLYEWEVGIATLSRSSSSSSSSRSSDQASREQVCAVMGATGLAAAASKVS